MLTPIAGVVARQHIRCRQTGLLDASDVLFASSERGRRQDC